jgi:hypothetical protein
MLQPCSGKFVIVLYFPWRHSAKLKNKFPKVNDFQGTAFVIFQERIQPIAAGLEHALESMASLALENLAAWQMQNRASGRRSLSDLFVIQ